MPSDKDWQTLVEVLDPVAESADNKRVEEIKSEEGNPEDPAEGAEGAAKGQEPEVQEGENKPKDAPVDLSNYVAKDRVEEIVEDRLRRAQEKADRDKANAEAKAAQDALEKNQQFEELANARAAEIETLKAELAQREGVEETLSTYRERVGNSVKSRMENLNLSSGVVALLEKMDPAEQQDWLDENEGDFAATTIRVPDGEDPASDGVPPEADEEARDAWHAAASRDF